MMLSSRRNPCYIGNILDGHVILQHKIEDRSEKIGIVDALTQIIGTAAGDSEKTGQQVFVRDDHGDGLKSQRDGGVTVE